MVLCRRGVYRPQEVAGWRLLLVQSRPNMSLKEPAKKRPNDQPRRAINAGLAGALMGAIGGTIIGAAVTAPPLLVALICALIFGLGEGFTDYYRKAAQLKPLAWRIFVAAFFGAILGSVLYLLQPDINLVLAGLFIGLLSGLFGLHWQNMLLGGLCGLALGLLASRWPEPWHPALLGALIVLVYRLLSAWLFRKRETISVAAERVPAAQIRYVVPFEAHSGYIGADYFKDLARTSEGTFRRNAPDIGIVASLYDLRGPTFDPRQVDPLIREFYEHTSRFKLAIVPVWQPLMKPIFLLYKQFFARRIGQANLPFSQEEAQKGVVSYIDTIDYQSAGASSEDIVVLRGWVRAFSETDEAIYVGIYTTFRYEDRGYVSVGFPLPESNFTATLLPNNHNGSNFLLTSRNTGLAFPGHYLSFFDEDELTVMNLHAFGEEIEVYVQDGQLRTDHRFYLGNQLFLTLFYTMQRVTSAVRIEDHD